MARALWASLLASLAMLIASPAMAVSPFQDWAAVVVAGDWRAHSGGPSEAFDNARRDVSHELARIGFSPANTQQFSVRPERYKDVTAQKSNPKAIYESLVSLTAKTKGGCLVYFSSHGAPTGILVDEDILPPGILATMLDRTCGNRPTVVVLSACFSGVFVPYLATGNRMILTAARPDRTSFGCGETNKYPFFDECFLQTVGSAKNFPTLAGAVQSCVAEREIKEGMTPPSEPQLFIGAQLRPILPLYSFPVLPPPKGS